VARIKMVRKSIRRRIAFGVGPRQSVL